MDTQSEEFQMAFRRGKMRAMSVDITPHEDDPGTVHVRQLDNHNGYIMTQKELVERARSLYPEAKVRAEVWHFDAAVVTVEWVQEQMKELGIKRKDLTYQLAVNSSHLSSVLTGAQPMTKSMKSMFYYYFLCYRLNRDLRSYIKDLQQGFKRLQQEQP